MDAKKLASLLRGGPGGPLVIDSRSFVEYNSWHVLSSVNICCSKLVKRRLQQGKVTIAELIQPTCRSQVPPRARPSPPGSSGAWAGAAPLPLPSNLNWAPKGWSLSRCRAVPRSLLGLQEGPSPQGGPPLTGSTPVPPSFPPRATDPVWVPTRPAL